MTDVRRNQHTLYATDENGVETKVKTFDTGQQARIASKILLERDSDPKITSTRVEVSETVVQIDFEEDINVWNADEKAPNPLKDI